MIAHRRRRNAMLGADLYEPIVVDLFAGGGGASLGIERVVGRCVDVAVNHDAKAVAMHRANHPHTLHLQSDIFEVDPAEATARRPVDLLWASPDCTFFSRARGKRPIRTKDRRSRALAWVVVRWAKRVRPRLIMLENVEEFAEWGPVARDGRPCAERRGSTFRRWVRDLERLGYAVEWRALRACDYGAPTIRKRLFLIARCDGAPIRWPQPTHGPGLKPYRTAALCIDWSLACPSIFDRAKPLAENTQRRIAAGIRRFVLDAAEPFIVHLSDSACAPFFVPRHGERAGQSPRCRSADQPMPTVTSTGNGASLVAAFLSKHNGGAVGQDAREPLHTIAGNINKAVTAAHLVKLRGTCRDGQDLRRPAPTITSGGTHAGLVAALLVKYYGNERDGISPGGPMHTIPTKDRFGLVTTTIEGESYVISDIGMRMLQPHELYAAQGFPDEYIHDHGVEDDGTIVPLTKTDRVRLCGNSVCPPVVEAMVEANLTHSTAPAPGSGIGP